MIALALLVGAIWLGAAALLHVVLAFLPWAPFVVVSHGTLSLVLFAVWWAVR